MYEEVKMATVSNHFPSELKRELHKALAGLESFEECAFLGYPNYANVGDHLIWLGGLSYFIDTLKVKVKYVSANIDFSSNKLEGSLDNSNCPIFFCGGGNLGDLWHEHQIFREYVIAKYPERPIVIFPQAIYFKDEANLKTARQIFNAHPDLTLVTRDQYSYQSALKYFDQCKNILAPDLAFQLADMPGLSSNFSRRSSILYHCRNDSELDQSSSPQTIDFPDLRIEDWLSFQDENAPRSLTFGGIQRIFSQSWQQGELLPSQWISQRIWKFFHPYAGKFKSLPLARNHLESLRYMHYGVHQFRQHQLIITNRLHGHILCVLMGIPHVVIPNSYHKITSFHETWTNRVPFCKLVTHHSQVKEAAEELLDTYYPEKFA